LPDYLDVIYDYKSHPKNTYPHQLTSYLSGRFSIKKGQKLLEPGCGRGDFLAEFHKLGIDCSGLDLSLEAGKSLKDTEVRHANLEKDEFPYPNDCFDVIYHKSLLEHLQNPENFMKEVYRVLKPGGLLLSLVPDWESNYKTYFDDYTHKTPFTFVSLRDIYLMFGFESVSVVKFRQLPIVWKYPQLNILCDIIAPFVPVRTEQKFLRWSRELMLIGSGIKPQ
jgi:SAM-dependent methyltransferase